MAWFRRKKEEKKAEKTDDLRDQFREAVYGRFFRTISFVIDEAGPQKTEWLEAVRVAGQGWQVVRKTTAPMESVVYQEPGPKGLSFFEAAEHLSKYEIDRHFHAHSHPADENEAATLGECHVRAFAEREGLAFDDQGLPHATAQGYIVSAGFFPPEVQGKALAAFEEKAKMMIDLNGDVFSADPIHGDLGVFDYLMDLKDLKAPIEKVVMFLYPFEHGRYRFDRHCLSIDSQYIYDHSELGHPGLIGLWRILEEEEKEYIKFLDKVFGKRTDLGLRNQFMTAWHMTVLFSLMSVFSDMYERTGADTDRKIYSPSNKEKVKNAIVARLEALGYKSRAAQFIYNCLESRNQGRPMKYVPEIDKVISWVDSVIAQQKAVIDAKMTGKPLPQGRAPLKALPQPRF